jgi:hypothetical protein
MILVFMLSILLKRHSKSIITDGTGLTKAHGANHFLQLTVCR